MKGAGVGVGCDRSGYGEASESFFHGTGPPDFQARTVRPNGALTPAGVSVQG